MGEGLKAGLGLGLALVSGSSLLGLVSLRQPAVHPRAFQLTHGLAVVAFVGHLLLSSVAQRQVAAWAAPTWSSSLPLQFVTPKKEDLKSGTLTCEDWSSSFSPSPYSSSASPSPSSSVSPALRPGRPLPPLPPLQGEIFVQAAWGASLGGRDVGLASESAPRPGARQRYPRSALRTRLHPSPALPQLLRRSIRCPGFHSMPNVPRLYQRVGHERKRKAREDSEHFTA